ncbi:unnamed protein product [Polarella glacialis]|uniref:VWFA domain-containing protein n=1 Tax=Polarella glacialis TaxID=89957 RepID=A0A813IJA8_POLGL|nr:unnamed protein product [Polarella glacialis]
MEVPRMSRSPFRNVLLLVAALCPAVAGNGSVSVLATPLLPEVLAGSPGQLSVLFSVTAPSAWSDVPEQDLVVMLDISTSMAEHGKLPLAKVAIAKIIEALRAGDRLHLIACHGTARIEFTNGTSADKEILLSALSSLQPIAGSLLRPANGGPSEPQEATDLLSGLSVAEPLLLPLADPTLQSMRRLMVFTDGKVAGGLEEGNRIIQAVESLQLRGALTSVVALGPDYDRWLLQTAGDVGRGGFFHLEGKTNKVDQVVAIAAADYFRILVTNAELRLTAHFGAEISATSGHRRRSDHRRRATARLTTESVPIGSIRTGRSERLLVDLYLPVLRADTYVLTYELLFPEAAAMITPVRGQVQLKVPQPGILPAKAVEGVALFQRMENLLLLQEELRAEQEATEANGLPQQGTGGLGSRWSSLTHRWQQLKEQLNSLAADAAEASRRKPGVAQLGLAQRAWSASEAGRGRGSNSLAVCEGTPLQQACPQGVAGLGL